MMRTMKEGFVQPNLSFLPASLVADSIFQNRWHHAVLAVNLAANSDLDLSVKPKKQSICDAAEKTLLAARLLKNEIDRGAFAQLFPIGEFVMEYGLSDDDVKTVRRFLNLLEQHTFVLSYHAVKKLPKKQPKLAVRQAAYFAGRLCGEFGLDAPTDYLSTDHSGESVAISLMRCLLIESRAYNKPSDTTLRRGMAIAKEGFKEFKLKTPPLI